MFTNGELSDPETDIPYDSRTEAPFQLPQNLSLRNLFQFVMQGGLQDSDVENTVAEGSRSRVSGDEIADNGRPCFHHLIFVEPFAQAELLHQSGQKVPSSAPSIRPRFELRQTPPFGNDGVAQGSGHG